GGQGESDAIAHPLRLARQQADGNPPPDSFVPVNPLAFGLYFCTVPIPAQIVTKLSSTNYMTFI
ncbi:hypothetical protein, partial [Sphingobium aromaticivastans]|uniref:hypothetical protein n=1 Tax=Sphingobium aromaticivastans TaxID=1778665 RepID=UPI00301ADDB0